jgi:hypothetical protein
LDASPARVPQWPPIWICDDCHLSNLDPLADVKGEVDVQIRDFDQTVIGNPAHDIIRLGLSLASAARDSNLPGVPTARMLEQLMQGYDQGLEMNPDDGSTDTLKPPGDPNSVETIDLAPLAPTGRGTAVRAAVQNHAGQAVLADQALRTKSSSSVD